MFLLSGRVPVSKIYKHLQLERFFRTRDYIAQYIYHSGFHGALYYLQNNFCPLRFKKTSVFSSSMLDGPQYKVVSSSDMLLNIINDKCWYEVDYLKLTHVVNEFRLSFVSDYHLLLMIMFIHKLKRSKTLIWLLFR